MIEYGNNDKISGVWFVTDIISPKLITVSEKDMTCENGRHEIHDVSFSPKIKEMPDLKLAFSDVSAEFIDFYRFVEDNERLKNGTYTGMTALNLFADGKLKLEPGFGGIYILYVSDVLYDSVPRAERYLTELVRTILKYADEEEDTSVEVYPMNGKKTEYVDDELSVTFTQDSEIDAKLFELKTPEVPKESAETLTRIAGMFENIEKTVSGTQETVSEMKLKFDGHRFLRTAHYQVEVPDGFAYNEIGENDFIMWLVNPENPDEYEASLFRLQPEKGDRLPERGKIRRVRHGHSLHMVAVKTTGGVMTGFRADANGITDENQRAAVDIFRMILKHITAPKTEE